MEYVPKSLAVNNKRKGLHPSLLKTRIAYDDFVCVSDERELLDFMNTCFARSQGMRVISSGWSWNKIIEADEDSYNVIFTGELSTKCHIDNKRMLAQVAGGLMIADFIKLADGLAVEWPPKGYCVTPNESQCFAGFVAPNVHHSYLPTAYEWVESVTVAVWVNEQACIIQASRTQNGELFESVFGAVGITGIIVSLQLRLRLPTWYKLSFNAISYSPHSVRKLLMRIVEEDNCLVAVTPHERTASIRSWEVLPTGDERCSIQWNIRPSPVHAVMAYASMSSQCLSARSFASCFALFGRSVLNISGFLPYYTAFSMHAGRQEPMAKGAVAMDERLLDISMFCPVERYSVFANILANHLESMPAEVGLVFTTRYVPKGGGIIAANCSASAVAVDAIGLKTEPNDSFMESLWDDLMASGVSLQVHLGKSNVHHDVFRSSLSVDQRTRLQSVVDQYDPKKLFDRGQVRWCDIYDMDLKDVNSMCLSTGLRPT